MKSIFTRRLVRFASALWLCWVVGAWPVRQPIAAQPDVAVAEARARMAFGKLPLRFAAAGNAVVAGSSFSTDLPNTTRRGSWFYQSTDRAATWSAGVVTTTPAMVNAFAFAPGNPSRVYAATGLGVFRSNDSGATWRRRR
jgi:photosystem II stability/assembly factor-like uncharacterized protein